MNRRTFLAATVGSRALAAVLGRARLGACTAVAGYGLFQAIDAIRRLGFRSIEIQPMGELQPTPGRFPGFEFDRLAEADRQRLRQALSGFDHISSHLPYAGLEFFSRDLAVAGAAARRLEIAMEASAYFGATIAVLHVPPPKSWPLEEAWPLIVRRLHEWGDIAAKAKFRLAVETGFPNSVAEFVRLVREVDHEAVGCTIDVGHQGGYKELVLRVKQEDRATPAGIRAYNDTTHTIIDQLNEKVFHFHVHDIDPATWREHQPIGTGFVDYPRLFGKLERIGYRGLLILEIGGRGAEMEARLADSKRRLEELL